MNEMIWVKILPGLYFHCNVFSVKLMTVMANHCCLYLCVFRLNQSLSWPFREVVATALYDFTPREPNQLPLRQGCQVLVIGKEGDSKGWWRGKTMERVRLIIVNKKQYTYARKTSKLIN